MATIFESLWTNKMGVKPDPTGIWSKAFEKVSEKQIHRGLQRVIDSGKDFPPSLPMFKAMCIQKTADDYIREMLEETNRNFALPHLPDKEIGKKHLAELKQKLGRRSDERGA